jgi:hypothetical protein
LIQCTYNNSDVTWTPGTVPRCSSDVTMWSGPNTRAVGKPHTDSVPPTMQSQIPKSRDVTLFFLDMTLLQVSGHALFTSTPHVFLLNIFINKTERSIHFYWIHFLNKIVTWLMREYMYLWYRLLEINVGTRDTAADEML